MGNRKKSEYNVGYGKPPTHSRFQKGQSGNAKGRPKKQETMSDLMLREINSYVTVVEGGRSRRISKMQAMCKQFVKRALQGDLKSFQQVVELVNISRSPDAPKSMAFTFDFGNDLKIKQGPIDADKEDDTNQER